MNLSAPPPPRPPGPRTQDPENIDIDIDIESTSDLIFTPNCLQNPQNFLGAFGAILFFFFFLLNPRQNYLVIYILQNFLGAFGAECKLHTFYNS